MLSKVYSGATIGLKSVLVEVEVDLPIGGFPGFIVVGLPGKAVKEACERVRSAIKNSGFNFPQKRIIVNLTPANLPKDGTLYDLPIALGILMADEQVKIKEWDGIALGELSLDGSLREISGALPLTILAKKEKLNNVFLPQKNAKEASIVSNVNVFAVMNLKQAVDHLNNSKLIKKMPLGKLVSNQDKLIYQFDMADVRGQEQAKRALEISAAGGHNILMMGPPGSGKTMLAKTLPSILPEMTEEEILEVSKIYSITGKLSEEQSAITTRPFCNPHHTTSTIGLIGGGSVPMPGEISLAHNGVLFLDEFLEFPRVALESLRQPIEDGVVTISRAVGSLKFPAKFILVAAANPCPCGNLGSKTKHCTCLPGMVARYRQKLSGPIMDRIDLHVSVPEVEVEKLGNNYNGEKSEDIRKRVNLARDTQIKRFNNLKMPIYSNGAMNTKMVKTVCKLENEARTILNHAIKTMGLSARAYFKVIKVAQTIADLAGMDMIGINHMAEALQYRPKGEEES